MKTSTKLTEKESVLFNRIGEGMDEPHKGWLHELTAFTDTIVSSKSISGVVGSLIKKGLITSFEDDDIPDCYWIELTEKGIAHYEG